MISEKQWFAEVAPAIPLPATGPQVYTYRVPGDVSPEALLYTQVKISLGRRQVLGVVTKVHQRTVPYPTKELVPGAPWQLTVHQVSFAHWLHDTMRGGLGYSLRLFFPPGKQALLSKLAPTPKKKSKRSPAREARQAVLIDYEEQGRLREYRKLITEAVARGQQVLMVVPELWLVERWQQLLQESLPDIRVVSSCAGVATTVATQLWHDVQVGSVEVVVGTQKSLFLPFGRLHTVIVEEEFYFTHKLWDQYPRLDTRIAAARVATIHQASLVLAGSLNSIATYYQVREEVSAVLRQQPLPVTTAIIPLAFSDTKMRRLLPEILVGQMKAWLAKKERVVVLHNAIGTWRVLLCQSCHTAVRCPTCGVTAAIHGKGKKLWLVCRHCDQTFPIPATCPVCHKKKLTMFGAGNERVADIMAALFPRTPLAVVDASVTMPVPKKPAGSGQILLGTSALFTRVRPRSADRVVYLFPERALLYPDFRSEERVLGTVARLAQLLKVTRPVTIVTAKKQLVTPVLGVSYEKNYERILRERKIAGYPPYQDLVLVSFSGVTVARAREKAVVVRDRMVARQPEIQIRGPFASFQKIKRGKYEQHLLLLGKLPELTAAYAAEPVASVDVLPERIL